MKKRLLIAVGVAVSALALAVVVVQGARGRGVAVNQQGVPATFAMDVVKRTSGDRVDVRGPFTFAVPRVSVTHPELSIHMRNAARFEKDGNRAHFSGRAVARLGGREIPGVVVVRVADNRRPGDPPPSVAPDVLAVLFEAAQGSFRFQWEGHVRDGDIAVFERVLE
ncbi:MAG: hypothetical protein HND43_06590 [Armatimonadetes bacterium]|uniref:DUF5666 domain-containing protein n=1 Tax=Candidatus Nitrosymbiomonas proteolyticus TaxID=2608984 RepID=A0A809R7L6_9BACT|nr:hypothetical protein [Fimbriimonadaceae bacterium]NOG39048.1 hypothetical protein [Armatimonadota bacterium]QOJ10922.1 MAG: hypothetical protein HRU74_02240 [Chthonomonadaceae bacterium]BBO23469.1 conserved hypothetical protein [Candidatus Nitrosymbiomonas proteolyticus]MCK6631365.1 hypothetical protein [Fimbriimonadaceae bacterium]